MLQKTDPVVSKTRRHSCGTYVERIGSAVWTQTV
jgi:hypothetical protein